MEYHAPSLTARMVRTLLHPLQNPSDTNDTLEAVQRTITGKSVKKGVGF
ncbi:unnamed protein product [Tuber aestivum]|uniref:Uncharacterized protein n=1 Tax=Tuber aestivum TaxID=59557 RepID=A0A292Q7X1_9PEZI|nr:unnamed protein product [Tuber aestivum]